MASFRVFGTVRAKLLSLVLLFAGVTLASVPGIYWLLHRQLVEEVQERVLAAEKAFQTELDDDLADLSIAARVIAGDAFTSRAIAARDVEAAARLPKLFINSYPDLRILVMDEKGDLLASAGATHPVQKLAELNGRGDHDPVVGEGLVLAHGCQSTAAAHPAFVLEERTSEGGMIVACMPLGRSYLANSSVKLGLELAFAVISHDSDAKEVLETTRDFPALAVTTSSTDVKLENDGDKAWGVARFLPRQFRAGTEATSVVEALDVTDIKRILRDHLFGAVAGVLLAGFLSVIAGSLLATRLSRPILLVTHAIERLEHQEYEHVYGVTTGDELELLANGFNSMLDGLRERDRLRTTFGKYMTASVMDHLLAGKVELGGESMEVTILFSDIRSFTSISETMSAQALVGLLNEYFTEMVAIIMQEQGVVDKYIGDAIMAVFGAPVGKHGDAVRAVRAAVRMRQALFDLNVRLVARGMSPLRTGIGLHTGEVIAGNIGCENRMEYTVIGDAVNLASRLESSTKELGAAVIISEDTFAKIGDQFITRPIREITVKGRAKPVMTYAVEGLAEDAVRGKELIG